jgi:hypothetical protein
MSQSEEKGTVTVVSACMRSDGFPDFAVTEVEVTPEEYDNGVHYLLVDESLAQRGYEEPRVHFDEMEAPPFLHAAVKAYLETEAHGALTTTHERNVSPSSPFPPRGLSNHALYPYHRP